MNLTANKFTATRSQNEFGHARTGQRSCAKISTTLETVRGVSMHAVAARRLANAGRVEPGRLDQNVLGLLGDHRVEAAHYAGECYRLFSVGDDQVFGVQSAFDAIKRLQTLSGTGPAPDDRATLQQVKIKGVRRMPQLVQGVIAGVHGIADAAGIQ